MHLLIHHAVRKCIAQNPKKQNNIYRPTTFIRQSRPRKRNIGYMTKKKKKVE